MKKVPSPSGFFFWSFPLILEAGFWCLCFLNFPRLILFGCIPVCQRVQHEYSFRHRRMSGKPVGQEAGPFRPPADEWIDDAQVSNRPERAERDRVFGGDLRESIGKGSGISSQFGRSGVGQVLPLTRHAKSDELRHEGSEHSCKQTGDNSERPKAPLRPRNAET